MLGVSNCRLKSKFIKWTLGWLLHTSKQAVCCHPTLFSSISGPQTDTSYAFFAFIQIQVQMDCMHAIECITTIHRADMELIHYVTDLGHLACDCSSRSVYRSAGVLH